MIILKSLNRSFGMTLQGEGFNETGAFENCASKINILAGTCGDSDVLIHWIKTWTNKGMTIVHNHCFISMIGIDLTEQFLDKFFVSTLDNLNSHKNQSIGHSGNLYS